MIASRCAAICRLLLCLVTLSWALPVKAAVEVHFYSKELTSTFPHAFVVMAGTLDGTGEKIAADYGFTARTVAPTILLGPVNGYVQKHEPDYIAKAERQFSVTVDDATYSRMMKVVAEWQQRKQPSYSLSKRNCIHFVMEMAEAAGLRVNRKSQFFRKPRSFLLELRSLNPGLR